jgi:hypothetical protein
MKTTSSLALTLGLVALVGPLVSAQSLSRNPNGPRERSGGVAAAADALLSAQTITQSTSLTVTAANSVSCNGGAPNFFHTDNSYYRGFTLSAFPALTLPQFLVQQVSIGVEQATGASGSQPVTLTVWKATANPIGGAPNPPGNNAVSTLATTVTNQNLTVVPLTLTTQPVLLVASDVLAVELFTPNGQATSNTFFVGSNASGQAGPSYIKAGPCGVNNISDTAGIGFPNMHIVMTVLGNNQTPVELQELGIE